MYNNVTIIGRLGRDPQSRVSKSGKQLCSFPVAVETGYGDNKTTDWFNVTVFDKTSEYCQKYITKGTLVLVNGAVHLRTFEGKDGKTNASLDLIANQIKALSKSEHKEQSQQQVQQVEQVSDAPMLDGDIPF